MTSIPISLNPQTLNIRLAPVYLSSPAVPFWIFLNVLALSFSPPFTFFFSGANPHHCRRCLLHLRSFISTPPVSPSLSLGISIAPLLFHNNTLSIAVGRCCRLKQRLDTMLWPFLLPSPLTGDEGQLCHRPVASRMAKEAKQKYLDASSKVKALKQKANDDIPKAIDSKDGEQEAQQARAELLESKAMLSKIVVTQTYKRLTLSREILWKSALLGCKVPADMRMIEMLRDQLRVDQGILTESFFLMVHVQGRDLTSGSLLRGCMHLVDLAGSERLDKTEAVGDRLNEAQHINRSLSALGDVISSLAQKQSHVPYRNSKLTQLLQDLLGGKAKTLMFVHISPEPYALEETNSTLKFVERVSTVELGAAKANKEGSDVKELKEQIATLKAALAWKERGESAAVHYSRYSSPDRQGIKSSGSSPSHSSTAVFCILLVFLELFNLTMYLGCFLSELSI
ncbi:hypothetical protein OROHE_005437 [Orobanche hederae]